MRLRSTTCCGTTLAASSPRTPRRTPACLYRELLAPRSRGGPPRGGELPPQPTTFVGRRGSWRVRRQLDASRLVTLMGPGGCGKTRLALEARAGVDRSADGVWFVELAGVTDPSWSPRRPRWRVGVPIPARCSAPRGSRRHLASVRRSLVLDNCEHVVDACARLAEDLLRACPGVRVLATSREPLRCEGEVAWRVPVLAEARRACSRSAHAARSGLQPPPTTTAARRDICRRLDGMPLAIELAAARVRRCRRIRSPRGWTTASTCSPPAAARRAAPADAARDDRLEPRPARPARSGCSSAAWRVFAGGFTWRPPRTCARATHRAAADRRPVARLVDKSLVIATGPALPPARHHPPVRRRAPRRVGRARDDRRAPPRLVPGPGRGARPALRRPAPLAAHAWRPSTTTCARA